MALHEIYDWKVPTDFSEANRQLFMMPVIEDESSLIRIASAHISPDDEAFAHFHPRRSRGFDPTDDTQ